jgi:hypothetical protein
MLGSAVNALDYGIEIRFERFITDRTPAPPDPHELVEGQSAVVALKAGFHLHFENRLVAFVGISSRQTLDIFEDLIERKLGALERRYESD